MIEDLYEVPFFRRRHRAGLFGPHIDALAVSLAARGYAADTIRIVLTSVRAFGMWLREHDHAVSNVDARLAARFVTEATRSETRSSGSRIPGQTPLFGPWGDGGFELVDYLRDALDWGGFPGCQHQPHLASRALAELRAPIDF